MNIKYEHLFLGFCVFLFASGAWFWLDKIVDMGEGMNIRCTDNKALFFTLLDSDLWCQWPNGTSHFVNINDLPTVSFTPIVTKGYIDDVAKITWDGTNIKK